MRNGGMAPFILNFGNGLRV